jgi:PAS domain S-box-containing protein
VEVHSTPIEQTGKTILFSIIHDISDRKRLENSLAQKTSLLECLLNSIPDIVFFKDNNGTYLGCNEQCAAFMGRKIEDVPGLTDYDLLPKDMADCCLENDLLMIEIGLPRRNEERAIHSDGRHLLLETVKAPLKSADGMPMGILGVSRDITDRKQMEESLRKSEENLRIVADYTHDWEYWIDHNGVLVYVSPSCARITGFTTEEFINRPSLLQEIVHPEDGRMAHDHFSLSEDANFPLSHLQFRINTRSGEIRWISHFCQSVFASDGAWLGRRASNHDITYEKQMSEELMENKVKLLNSTRLESLALMAGGIAHDFNNQLMTVLGNLELALNEAPDGSKIRTRIETAIMATNRSAVLSNQMLAYTGQRYFRSDNVNIHQLIDEQSGSIRSALSRSVTLDIQTASDVPTIVADEDQVKQILINLLKNASESYGEKEGEVRLSTGVMECDKAYLAQSRMEQKADPGWFVFFDVSDKGCGMDEETQARIFDPFFSTKFWGRGLGMAETMGIVKSHNGAIILNSELGNGTTVRVLLPVPAPEQPASSTFADFEKNEATVPELIGRPKTILVVEDEDSVRQLCKELLEIFGYHTITASDGLEGVEMFKANQNRIDLVLLDLLLPRMNGIEAYAEFIKIKPDIKVLISSGFSQESLEEKIKGALPAGYLHKPYQMENLKEEIERILGA